MDTSTTQKGASSAALWVIGSLLVGWLAAVAVSHLPHRAKPLLLLPVVLGVGLGGVAEKLREAVGGPPWRWASAVVPGVTASCMALVSWNGYLDYRQTSSLSEKDQLAQGLGLQMLRSDPDADPEMLRRYEAEIEAVKPGPTQYLTRKFAPLGAWTRPLPWGLLAVELALAAAAGGVGARLARRQAASG